MRESRLKVKVVWTSIWAGLIFGLRLVQSFFPVQKAVLHSILDSNHQLWELSNTRNMKFQRRIPAKFCSWCCCQAEASVDVKKNEALSMCILARLSCSLCGPVSALPVSSVSSPSMPQAACSISQEWISEESSRTFKFPLLNSPTPCFPFSP
jgi:hypothetical protein